MQGKKSIPLPQAMRGSIKKILLDNPKDAEDRLDPTAELGNKPEDGTKIIKAPIRIEDG